MMQASQDDDPTDPRRKALIDQMDGPSGVLAASPGGGPAPGGQSFGNDTGPMQGGGLQPSPQALGSGVMMNQMAPSARGVDFGNATFNPSPNTGIGGAGRPGGQVGTADPNFQNDMTGATKQSDSSATSFDRTAFRDAINGAPNAYDVLKQYGLTPDKAGRVTLPTGEIMDVIRGAGGGGTTGQWMGAGEVGRNGQAVMYANGGGQALGQGAGANGTAGGAGGALDATYRDTLLKMMQGYGQPIDDNTPGIAQPYGAARLSTQRSQEEERKAIAERAYAQGGGNVDQNLLNQGVQQSAERNAQGLAQYKGSLYQGEIAAQRQQLSHALDLANAVGARTEAAQLQKQLADMDQQYRYASLGENSRQFDDTKAFDWTRWQTDQNRLALLDGMH